MVGRHAYIKDESMSADTLTKVMRDALMSLEQIDAAIAEEMPKAEPHELKKAFKNILTAMVPAALSDIQVRRNVKNHMIFLIERLSEKLQDLVDDGDIQNGSDYMRWIDRAHRYAAKLASDKTGGQFVENFDVDVKPVSLLDTQGRQSPEERRARTVKLQNEYLDYRRNMKAGDV